MAKSLGSSVFRATLTATMHVKLVSMVVRGERVREEKAVVLEDWLMVIRSPDTISTPALSCQVKEYKMPCVSTTVRSNRAEHLRVMSSALPVMRGPVDVTSRDTVGAGTVWKGTCRHIVELQVPTKAYSSLSVAHLWSPLSNCPELETSGFQNTCTLLPLLRERHARGQRLR